MKPWHYLIHLLLPALVIIGYTLGGWWNFLLPACCFLAYPVINLFLSPDSESHTHTHDVAASSNYSKIALAFVPVLIGLTGWCIYSVSSTNIQGISFYGLGLSVGIVNGVLGFTLAHEFSHRFTKTEMMAGYLLLLQNNYLHYRIEHVWGHHVYACTTDDPHTARIGESVYAYLPRAISSSYKNAFKIEAKRLSGSGVKMPLIRNRIFHFGLLQIALILAILLTLGGQACWFFLLQSIIAILILHIINYMQHYGLMRNKTSTGNYEKLNAHHAWNNGRQNNSLSLFQLENHADHHMHPGKSFDKLNNQEHSPEQPAGYSAMFLLALIPPLWFKIMNKRIPSHHLNIQT